MNRIFKTEYLGITAFIFIIIWLFTLIPLNLEFINPIEETLNDFDTSDIVFSRFREDQHADTNIVIINIGYLDRFGIANKLDIVNDYNPKVIGLDIFFWENKNNLEDSILAKSIAGCKNIVLVSKLGGYNKETCSYDTLFNSINIFQNYAYFGYANLPSNGDEDLATIRNFKPRVMNNKLFYDAFAVKVASLYNKGDSEYLYKRDNELEIINYRGNKNKFFFMNTKKLEEPNINLNFLKGKIVLFGFVGNEKGSRIIEDIYYTPLNKKYVGKTIPDMYGIIIHANIISMIINRDYISTLPNWVNFMLAVIICYLNIVIVKNIKVKYNDWFDISTILIVLIESIILLFLSLQIFMILRYKISLTIILISLILIPDGVDFYDNFSIKIRPLIQKFKNLIN